ncbi:hypothetical protein D9O36_12875 [Zobellia amurskyensis]|uniref:LVIVD repeat-containing protein n=1 Tax=Zobellia amurskyensis TaxID=248905 RepID=A0A7X3D2L1_9FLAO|nr:hypothetical protein [Zobellia amurskyensis]MUH36740.1 hypothetical protein [Zobellia amurskyensis]
MKKNLCFMLLTVIATLVSCNDDKDDVSGNEYLVATPLTTNLLEFKEEAVAVTEPVPIVESGKIYAYQDYVFVNDVHKGFHVIDNSNPSDPSAISFIKLEGNYDISIKDNRLYADSYGDLVIMDISDINNIKMVQRIEGAIYQQFWCTMSFDVDWPQADFFDYGDFDATKEAIVGWEVKSQRLSEEELQTKYGVNGNINIAFDSSSAEASSPTSGGTGQGGSLARFKIVEDYLYAVEWSSISVFDISDLDNPKTLEDVYVNGTIETIYNQGDILFIGGTQGMYIYDISSPEKPEFVSEFVHGTACDPVVVDGDYAFVTLRGENSCGNTESGLYIVNVSNLASPELQKFYPLEGPYGIGFKDNRLFVCDGDDGLKVFDKTDVNDLKLVSHFKDIVTYDVIPLEESLLMIGDKVLYQYKYLNNSIRLLSTLDLK